MKTFGPFRLDPTKRRLWRGDEVVPLTPKAFDTLLVLVSRAGTTVEKDDLLKAVWPDTFVEEATLAQNISTLRRALGDTSETPTFIATVPRRGYRFLEPVSEIEEDPSEARPREGQGLDGQESVHRQDRGAPANLAGMAIGTALALVAVGLIAVAVNARRPSAPTSVPVVFTISAPDGERFSPSGGFMAVSPDGRHIAFVASDREGTDRLWLRSVDSLGAHMLGGTERAYQPFWSSDSRFIAFFADGKLKKVRISSGPVQIVCDTPPGSIPLAGAWNSHDDILFSNARQGIVRVSATGGVATSLIAKESADDAVAWPQFLPDGRHFLFLLDSAQPDRAGIYVGALDSQERVRVSTARSSALYSPSGHLLFVQGGTLVAQAFDGFKLRVTGPPSPVAAQVAFNVGTGRGTFSVSQNSVLAFRSTDTNELVWVDRSGRPLGHVGSSGNYVRFAVSPDNSLVAASRIDPQLGASHIWIIEATGSRERRLTFDSSWETQPLWSRDGSRVAFGSNRRGRWEIYEKASNGDGPDRLLLSSATSVSPEDWSPDGRMLYQQSNLKTKGDFWLAAPGDGKPLALPYLESDEGNARISPDGRWIAYKAYESGWFIYVRSMSSPENRWQVSSAVDQFSEPRWRGDGKELFYLAPDLSIMAVSIEPGSAFKVGPARRLFPTEAAAPSGLAGQAYDVATDGQRFLVKKPASVSPITVVVNWTSLGTAR